MLAFFMAKDGACKREKRKNDRSKGEIIESLIAFRQNYLCTSKLCVEKCKGGVYFSPVFILCICLFLEGEKDIASYSIL